MAKKQQGKQTTQALTKWDQRLAELAAQATAVESGVGGGNVISMRGGVLQYKGAEIPENKLTAIVLDNILHNRYYDTLFDPNTPTAPACYAFGRTEDEMVPHENVKEPQNSTCQGCQQNEWGTADRGRGKACGNIRRLALISESDMEDIDNAEIAYMHIPVTSVRGWAGYVRQLDSTLHRPPLAVITEISVEPDPVTQFKVFFKMTETIDDGAQIEALINKAEQAKAEIMFPYVQIENAQPVAPARSQRGRNVLPARGKAQPAAPARGKAAAAPAQGARRSKF